MAMNTYLPAVAGLALIYLCHQASSEYYNPACPNSCGSEIGDRCENDYDCLGEGAICKNGRCACHVNYAASGKRCTKLPNRIGQPCQTRLGCIRPMTCSGSKCQCGNGFKRQGEACAPTRTTRPNVQLNRPVCPDGSNGGRQCIFKGSTADVVENTANTGGSSDNCPRNQYCVTDGISPSGFCCQAQCPFGSALPRATCDASSTRPTCPTATHYCHRMVGPTFSVSLCCPKPCREPTPIYFNGRCYSSASHLDAYSADQQDDERFCENDIQCDGGITMECDDGMCVCRRGFVEAQDKRKLSENCVKVCPEGQGAIDVKCLGLSGIKQSCYMDWQCGFKTKNSICHNGKCYCKCGYEENRGKCVPSKSETSCSGGRSTSSGSRNTGTSGTKPGGGILSSLGGNGGGIGDLIGKFLGGNGGGILGG